jgi:steroid delta-isomerase-like uncharacterized protein
MVEGGADTMPRPAMRGLRILAGFAGADPTADPTAGEARTFTRAVRDRAGAHPHATEGRPVSTTASTTPAPQTPTAPDAPTAAAAVVLRFLDEGINRLDLEAAGALLADDVVAHVAGMPEPFRGRAAWQQMASMFFSAFPDLHVTVEDVVAAGDRVAVRWTWVGTQRGAFMGIPATGRTVSASGTGFYHVAGGRIAEEWLHEDMLTVLQQLGAIPTGAGA